MTVTISRDTYDSTKNYDKVVIGSGVPVVDADYNELQEIQRQKLRQVVMDALGNGYPTGSDGFKTKQSGTDTSNNFALTLGDFYLNGYRLNLTADVEYKNQKVVPIAAVTAISTGTLTSVHKTWPTNWPASLRIKFVSGVLNGNTYTATGNTANTITTATDLQAAGAVVGDLFEVYVPLLTTPGGARTDEVYVQIHEEFINSTEDSSLPDPTLNVESTDRVKLTYYSLVIEGSTTPVSSNTLKVSTLSRTATAVISTGIIADNRNLATQGSAGAVTYTNLSTNGSIGQASTQVAQGDHNHVPLMMSASAGTVTIKKWDNTDLSSTNKVSIPVPSAVTAGKWVNAEFSANITFLEGVGGSFTNNTLGTTGGVAHAASMPLFIYIANRNDTNFAIFLSRDPSLYQTLAATTYIAQKGDANGDHQTAQLFLTTSETLSNWTSKPATIIGAISVTKSASDEWTTYWAGIQFPGFGEHAINTHCAGIWQAVAGQYGNASGQFVMSNGGTAPAFSSKDAGYIIMRNGMCRYMMYSSGDAGADGAGAVTAIFGAPYNFTQLGYGALNTAVVRTPAGYIASAVIPNGGTGTNTFTWIKTTTGGYNNWADFTNGIREISADFYYKAF